MVVLFISKRVISAAFHIIKIGISTGLSLRAALSARPTVLVAYWLTFLQVARKRAENLVFSVSRHLINVSTKTMFSRRIPPRTELVEVTPLDHCIAMHGGTTSTIDMLPHRLDIIKRRPPQSLSEKLVELTREVGYLREELARYKEVQNAMGLLYTKTVEAFELLEHGLEEDNLRKQLTSHREIQQSRSRSYASMTRAFEILKYGLQELSEKRARSEIQLLDYWGIDIGDRDSETLIL